MSQKNNVSNQTTPKKSFYTQIEESLNMEELSNRKFLEQFNSAVLQVVKDRGLLIKKGSKNLNPKDIITLNPKDLWDVKDLYDNPKERDVIILDFNGTKKNVKINTLYLEAFYKFRMTYPPDKWNKFTKQQKIHMIIDHINCLSIPSLKSEIKAGNRLSPPMEARYCHGMIKKNPKTNEQFQSAKTTEDGECEWVKIDKSCKFTKSLQDDLDYKGPPYPAEKCKDLKELTYQGKLWKPVKSPKNNGEWKWSPSIKCSRKTNENRVIGVGKKAEPHYTAANCQGLTRKNDHGDKYISVENSLGKWVWQPQKEQQLLLSEKLDKKNITEETRRRSSPDKTSESKLFPLKKRHTLSHQNSPRQKALSNQYFPKLHQNLPLEKLDDTDKGKQITRRQSPLGLESKLPPYKAKDFPEGTVRRGQDGDYISYKTPKEQIRWKKMITLPDRSRDESFTEDDEKRCVESLKKLNYSVRKNTEKKSSLLKNSGEKTKEPSLQNFTNSDNIAFTNLKWNQIKIDEAWKLFAKNFQLSDDDLKKEQKIFKNEIKIYEGQRQYIHMNVQTAILQMFVKSQIRNVKDFLNSINAPDKIHLVIKKAEENDKISTEIKENEILEYRGTNLYYEVDQQKKNKQLLQHQQTAPTTNKQTAPTTNKQTAPTTKKRITPTLISTTKT
jgi:hypothetical protein